MLSVGDTVDGTGRLSIRDLSATYPGDPPVRALDSVDLDVAAGSISAIIGPNGAGKTTLVSCVVGVIRAERGTVTLDGGDLLGHRANKLRATIGYAPQEEALYPILTVAENLRLFGELAGLRGPDLRRDIARAADAFLVGDLLGRRPRDLSGGQRRRVHNAIALLGHPSLVILDEPTAGVDPATRAAVLDAVRRAARDDGAAVCYSTHYLPEVVALDADVSILDHGRVIATGLVGDLLGLYGEPAVELRFDGPAPVGDTSAIGDVTVVGNLLRVAVAEPRAQVGRLVGALGDDVDRLVAVEISEADLDAVFLKLTGRRYAEDTRALDGATTEP